MFTFYKMLQIRHPGPSTSIVQYNRLLPIGRSPVAWFFKQKMVIFITVILLLSIFVSGISTGETETPLLSGEKEKTIVIDPGHGGYDNGAQGPEGTLEKTITLSFARMLATELGKKYRLHLTRTDDYRLEIPKRTAVANHMKADLFISIHTGASFLHTAGGISIFFFNEISDSPSMTDTESSTQTEAADIKIFWDHIQHRHKTSSSMAAQLIRSRFLEHMRSNEIIIQGAPLMILEGADMPAILIEVGYLTNPLEEKKLQDPEALSDIAKSISNGIDDFFQTDISRQNVSPVQ